MKRRRSKYRIVVKTKAQVEREKRLKAKKRILERQKAMNDGHIFTGAMIAVPEVDEKGDLVVKFQPEGFIGKEVKPE